MLQKFIAWLAVSFMRLLAVWWKREEKKVDFSSISIPVNGVNIPLSAFVPIAQAVFPTVEQGIAAGKPSQEIAKDVENALPQALIAVSEIVLNIFFPGAGTLEAAVIWLVENSKNDQMTQDQVNAWMDRFSIQNQ